MSFLKYITVILLFKTSCADKDTIPVLMLDTDQVMSHVQVDTNPFASMTASCFSDIVHDSIKRSDNVIIFVEDALSTEDISSKDKYGTPFINLRIGLTENKVKYIPSVVQPYKLLNQILQPQHFNVFYLRSHTKLQVGNNLKYVYIFFQDDVNETRSEILRRHDSIIRDVMFSIRQLKTGPVIAFYTGKMNPVSVQKLKYQSTKMKAVQRVEGVGGHSAGACIQLSGVYIVDPQRRTEINEQVTLSETKEGNSLTVTMQLPGYDDKLLFNFTLEEEWLLEYVALRQGAKESEEVGRKEMGVRVPMRQSYICGEPIVIVNTRDSSSVIISQYQIQPKSHGLRTNDDVKLCFDNPPLHCGPYFTPPILASLLCTALFLGITMHGITGLMDCNANDRYEDPNSTPLTHGG